MDSSLPTRKTSKVAGSSKTEGSVARMRMEARKASAFLERWLQAGENTRGSSQKPGKTIKEGDRCVGPEKKEGTQDRGKEETIAGKKKEGAGEEGREKD